MISTDAPHADYPHEPGTLYDCAACEQIMEAETLCREFARVYPGANVQRAISLCESGQVAWLDVAALFARSAAAAFRQLDADRADVAREISTRLDEEGK